MIGDDDVFADALALPSAQRAEFLTAACHGDAAQFARVEALLRGYDRAQEILPLPRTLPRAPQVTEESPGDILGRYRLLQKIGEGGMGVVYLAEQAEPVRSRVALKIIKLGLDTLAVTARFEAERQALALMDHPNIARVLDGGATDAGRPYFVMEWVRGIKITEYCDKARLSTRDRLDLFIQVCQAIQHAHQKGVIHRDIKPSNILVTINDGVAVPKVIDFGIAKAMTGRLTEKTLITQFEALIGTPAYMSPEQTLLTSVDVDTRSDIYSLGVLLYELLAGRTPFNPSDLLAAGLDEMRKTIREHEPVRPSTRLKTLNGEEFSATAERRSSEPSKLLHQLKGDLDWIVLKCLEKDRNRRYATANGLAADLKRHLNHEPVVARPPSTRYRFQKLVRRNRLAFAAAGTIASVLVIAVIVSTWQTIRATTAKREAVEQRRSAFTAAENARRAEQNAESQRNVAVTQRKFTDMQLAIQVWEEGDLQRARDLVEASRPTPGQLPGFEWRYLRKLCQDQSHETFGTSDQRYQSAQFYDRDLLLLNDGKKLTLRDISLGTQRLLLEDKEGIARLAFGSGNRNLLATVTAANRIKVWDLAGGRVRLILEGHTGNFIRDLTFSPDAKWLASASSGFPASSDNSVKLWAIESSEPGPARTFHRYSYGAQGVAFSPDGKQLFSTGTESRIRVWDVATSQATGALEGQTAWGGPIAMSPDGLWMASGAGDGAVIIWNASSLKLEKRLLGHSAPIAALAYSPDRRLLASAGLDQTIRLWDTTTGQIISVLRGHLRGINYVDFSPDGQWLVSRSRDGLVKLWQVADVLEGNVLMGSPEWLQGVALSPDGRHLASVASGSSAVNLWDLASRSRTLLEGHTNETVMCAIFSPDGRTLATGGHDETVRLWDVRKGTALATLTNEFPVGSLAFSPDGKTLMVGGSSFFILEGNRAGLQFWDVASQRATGTISGDASDIVNLALSASGSLLATAHKDGAVSVWDVPTRNLVHRFESQYQAQIMTLAFSPTEPLLAAGDFIGNIVLYNTTMKEVVSPALKGHTWRVLSIAFSPDGRTLAAAGEGGGLKLWNVATAQEVLTLKGHTGSVCGIAFSRDGNLLVSCGADAAVRLWPAATLEEITAAKPKEKR